MRKNYPVLSEELNDKFQDLYFKLTWILGYDDDEGNTTYVGQFDKIETDLREAIYLALPQINDAKDSLVLNKGLEDDNGESLEVALYTKWGALIIINELRSM